MAYGLDYDLGINELKLGLEINGSELGVQSDQDYTKSEEGGRFFYIGYMVRD